MPIPKPRKNEPKDDLISRCMSDETMNAEYEQDRRSAICCAAWEKKVKANSRIAGNITNYTIRYEEIDGIQYIVVPVVMSIPGVHHGSGGATLYTKEVLSFLPDQWNGRPVVVFYTEDGQIDHPKDKDGNLISANSPAVTNKATIGIIYNTRYDNGLKADVYINEEKLKAISGAAHASIISGQMLEVSIGTYEIREETSGEWKGEKYTSVTVNIISDHLALLPGGQGACSVADGCGIRANQGKEVKTMDAEGKAKEEAEGVSVNPDDQSKLEGSSEKGQETAEKKASGPGQAITALAESVKNKLKSWFTGDATNEQSDVEIRELLTVTLRSIQSDKGYIWIKEVFSDYFIYEKEVMSPDGGPPTEKMFKRTYSISDGKISLGDDPQEVRSKTEYVPVSNTGEGGSVMQKKEIIDFLITNGAVTQFNEEHRSTLEGMTECHLSKVYEMADKLIKANTAIKTQSADDDKVAAKEDPKTAATEVPTVEPTPQQTVASQAADQRAVQQGNASQESKQLSVQEFINQMPVEIGNALRELIGLKKTQQDILISQIVSANIGFAKEDLVKFDLPTLQKFHQVAMKAMGQADNSAGYDFSGNIGGMTPRGGPEYVPPMKVWEDLPI